MSAQETNESHIGHFTPSHERHESFSFLDADSGLVHRVDALAPDPEDSSKQRAYLTLEDDAGPVVEPQPVVLEEGLIQEGRQYKKILLGAGGAVLAVTVATGSLIIRHRRKSH